MAAMERALYVYEHQGSLYVQSTTFGVDLAELVGFNGKQLEVPLGPDKSLIVGAVASHHGRVAGYVVLMLSVADKAAKGGE
jgi:hypothetical protein